MIYVGKEKELRGQYKPKKIIPFRVVGIIPQKTVKTKAVHY
jgi:hypothetical protein|tara:strand:+ start:160 stop:282 length:123 start_codon:yes stop_codon:yes gene_type:complete